jgi:hypothetical protein
LIVVCFGKKRRKRARKATLHRAGMKWSVSQALGEYATTALASNFKDRNWLNVITPRAESVMRDAMNILFVDVMTGAPLLEVRIV